MRSILRKKSIKMYWFLSYIVVVAIFIVFSIGMFFSVEHILIQEMNKSNQLLMEYIRNTLDNTVYSVKNIGFQLESDVDIMRYVVNNKTQLENPSDTLDISKNLQKIKSITPNTSDVFVYFKKEDVILSSKGYLEADKYFKSLCVGKSDSYNELTAEIEDYKSEKYIIVSYMEGDVEKQSFIYVRSLYPTSSNNADYSIGVVFNTQSFLQPMTKLSAINNSDVQVYDNEQNLLISTTSDVNTIDIKALVADKSGVKEMELNGESSIVSYAVSEQNKWIYVNTVNKDIYLHNLRTSELTALIGLVFILILIGFSVYFFTKRNYDPIKELLSLISGHREIEQEALSNEYGVIKSALNQYYASEKDLSSKIYRQQQVIKKDFLAKLVSDADYESKAALSQQLENYAIEFPHERFAVLMLAITQNDEDYRLEQMYIIISNIMQEVLSNFHHVYTTEVDKSVVVILNTDKDIAVVKEDINNSCSFVQEILENNFKIQFTASASSLQKDTAAIPRLFEECKEAIQYKNTFDITDTVFYDEIEIESRQGAYYYPNYKENQLLNMLKLGDKDGAFSVIDQILDENTKDKTLNFQAIQFCLFNLTNTMIKAVSELSEQFQTTDLDPIKALLPFTNLEESRQTLKNFVEKLCVKMNSANEKKQNWIIKDVLPYIQENYAEQNLNLTFVADKFQSHPVYISRLFKEQVGEGLLDYINRIRIAKAIEMLVESDSRIEDIAASVGYASLHTFNRIFKKIEGIPPGKYKTINWDKKTDK